MVKRPPRRSSRAARVSPEASEESPETAHVFDRLQVAAALGLTVSGVRSLERRGALVGVRQGRTIRFCADEIAAAAAGKRRRAAAPVGALAALAPAGRRKLEPALACAALGALGHGATPLDLAIRYGLDAEQVRYLSAQYVAIAAMSMEAAARCDACTQPARLCYECAGAAAAPPGAGSA